MTKPQPAAFAIPGDLNTVTGGYIYERRLWETLNRIGPPVHLVPLLPSFPQPTRQAESHAAAALAALPDGMPLILDGLVFGSIDTGVLAARRGPVIAMLHHPLGLEAGLPPATAVALIARETANLRHAAHVVVPSPHTAAILTADFGVTPERITIALPGFDRPAAPPAPVPRAQPPLFLSVGILCARKGHDVLIEALARLAAQDWQAVIVGMTHDSAVEAALRAQIATSGLRGRVHLAGQIPPADLDRLFRQAHVFALATRYEGYGMVLAEALLHGLPVVSCHVGAVPQTLPEGTRLLTPPDDPAAFAGALERLLTDPALHDGLSRASARAGRALPEWTQTAALMRGVIDRCAAEWTASPSARRA